jgi:hypothetical protein
MRSFTSCLPVSNGLVLGLVALVLALGAPGQVEAFISNWKFRLVGVVFDGGQAVHVNVSSYPNPEQDTAPCEVQVEFFVIVRLSEVP